VKAGKFFAPGVGILTDHCFVGGKSSPLSLQQEDWYNGTLLADVFCRIPGSMLAAPAVAPFERNMAPHDKNPAQERGRPIRSH